MHILTSFSYLTALLLDYSVFASPTPLSSIDTGPQRISTIKSASSNTSLGLLPPNGPRDFECEVVALLHFAIQPKDMFLTAIGMLEDITQESFDGRLDRPQMFWKGPNNLIIVVTSIDAQPMPRRFLMWAIVRILFTMDRETRIGYHAAVFEPMWHERRVGKIEVAYTRAPNDQLSSGVPTGNSKTSSKSPASTNLTVTGVGDDDVFWFFEPYGPLMTQWDVALGDVGALLYAAQYPQHNFDQFSGDHLPVSRAVTYYRSLLRPSRLSKSILIRSIAQAAIRALNDDEFQQMRVRVFLDTREIAVGGYSTLGSVLSGPGQNISLADS